MESIVAFTTPIYKQKIEGLDLDYINRGILDLQKQDSGVIVSNRGGWQSHGLNFPPSGNEMEIDFMGPVIGKIFPFVNQAFLEYGFDQTDYFIHYWLNINKRYSYNKTHFHGDTKMSGVLYTRVPKDSGKIFFERPDTKIHKFQIQNTNNFDNYYIQPEDGLFVMFSGQLKHFVEQNLTEDEDDRRISIAFNFT